jgi:hypothetical protein
MLADPNLVNKVGREGFAYLFISNINLNLF